MPTVTANKPSKADKHAEQMAILQNLIDMKQKNVSPYNKGVERALKQAGEQHAMEAIQQGVPGDHIASQSGLNPQDILKGLTNWPPQTPGGDIRPLVIQGQAEQPPTQPQAPQPQEQLLQQQMPSFQNQQQINIPKQGWFEGNDVYGQRLDNLIKQQKIQSGGESNNLQDIQKMADLNTIIDKKLPGYQVTQTADGNFIVHPKAAGIMAQMTPEQVDSMSNSLVNGNTVPSQLPRIQKAQIISAALEKNPDYSPAQADMEFAANKMGASSFERNFNNLDSFHRDFEKNSDYLLKLSANFDRSKLPIVNRAIVGGGRSITGDPKATQLLQAVNTVANGYARLQNPTLAGQALSDAARKEAQDIISGFGSDAQIRSLLDPQQGSMRIDAQNRIDAAQEIRDRIKSTYNKKPKKSNDYSNYLKAIGK